MDVVTSLLEKAKCTFFGGAISLLNGLWPLVRIAPNFSDTIEQ